MFHSELCRRWESPPQREALCARPRRGGRGWAPSWPPRLRSPRWQGGQRGCAGRWKQDASGEQGTELPEPFPRGAGGASLAWLLPISFTSGWNRWRGAGWKSPSGWESHKCVNKCGGQSLLRCPGNSGLTAGECRAARSSPTRQQGCLGRKSFGEREKKSFSKENSCSPSCYSYFCFK